MSRPPRAGHGTYGHQRRTKCQCEPCLRAVQRYRKGLDIDTLHGVSRRQDPTAAREHVLALMAGGVTPTQIAHAAGLAHSVVSNLAHGKNGRPIKFLYSSTVDALMNVTLEQAYATDSPGLVLPIGALRRVEALEYMGYPQWLISEEMGLARGALCAILQKRCKTSNVQRLDEVYRRLRGTPGPSEIVRWRSYRNGHRPWMCWDDETIDDPAAKPYDACCVVSHCTRPVDKANLCNTHMRLVKAASKQLTDGRRYREVVLRLSKGDKKDGKRTRAQIAELLDLGYSEDSITSRLGLSDDYVARLRRKEAA